VVKTIQVVDSCCQWWCVRQRRFTLSLS